MIVNRTCQICEHQAVCKLWNGIKDLMHESKMLKIPMGYAFDTISLTIGEICTNYTGRDNYDR